MIKKLIPLAILASMNMLAAIAPTPMWLVWDDPNPVGSIKEYRLYSRRTATDEWAQVDAVPSKSWPIALPPGIMLVTVTAVSVDDLESDPAIPISLSVPRPIERIRLQRAQPTQ